MKVRIKGNTVRYRLSKSEVTALAKNGMLLEETEFINGSFKYAVQQTEKQHLSADFRENTITLYVPKHALLHWANTEQTGIDYSMPLPNLKRLNLLLEKDFKCIDADAKEDQSDYFENPLLTC